MSGRHFGAYGEELHPQAAPCASPQSQDEVDADARFARQLMEEEVFNSAPRERHANAYGPRRRQPRSPHTGGPALPTTPHYAHAHRSRSSDDDDGVAHQSEEQMLATALARSVGEAAPPSPADPQPQRRERVRLWHSPPMGLSLGLDLDRGYRSGSGSGSGQPRHNNYRRHADPLAVFLDSADGGCPPAEPSHPDLRSYAEAAAAPFAFGRQQQQQQRQRRRQESSEPHVPRWGRSRDRHAGSAAPGAGAFAAFPGADFAADFAHVADVGDGAHPRIALGGGRHAAVRGGGGRHGVARGSAGVHNEVDVDDMSYEDLLALQERVGSVVVGLPRELRDLLPRVEVTEQPDPPDKCAICMEEIEVGEVKRGLPCQDAYHAACIDEWFEQKTTCPVCQVDIRDVLS